MTEQDERFHEPDIFIISFESDGRCMPPQRLLVKEKKNQAFVWFYNNGDEG